MSLNIEVGKRIREHRKRAGLTQEELAALAGVSARTISDYERGKISTIKKVAEVLNTLEAGHKPVPPATVVQGATVVQYRIRDVMWFEMIQDDAPNLARALMAGCEAGLFSDARCVQVVADLIDALLEVRGER